MKFKSTGIFAALVVAFGAYVYFVEYRGTQQKEEKKQEQAKILNYKPEDVQSFSIQKEKEIIKVDRSRDGWVMTSPAKDQGYKTGIEEFLKALFVEKSDGVAAEGTTIDWNIFGLDKPKATFELKLKDKTVKLELGTVIGVAGKRYVRLDGQNKVEMVTGSIDTQLEKPAKDFREKSIFRISKDKVTKVKVMSGEATSFVVDKVNNDWAIEGNYKADSDKSAIQNYVNDISIMEAQDFSSEDKYKFQIGKLTNQVELDLDDGTKISAQVYKHTGDKFYMTVADKPTVYELAKRNFDLFSKTVSDLRDKRKPFQFEESKVSQIDYKTEGFDLNLKKDGEKWTSKEPVNNDKVHELFNMLKGLQVQKFYGKSSAGMYRPKGTITLKDQAGGVVLDLKWGNDDKKDAVTVVKTNKHEELFGIADSVVASLPGKMLLESENKPVKKSATEGQEVHGKDPSNESDAN